MDEKPAPAADEEKAIQESEPAPEDEKKDKKDEEKRGSRLAQSHREAEIIAENLKESGARR
jgi:hypothetical protein